MSGLVKGWWARLRSRASTFGSIADVNVRPTPLAARMEAEPTHIDSLQVQDDGIEVAGWVLPPADPAQARFLLNEQPFHETQYPLPKPAMEQRFWQRAHAGQSGFICRTRQPRQELFANGHLSFRVDWPGRGLSFPFQDARFFKDPQKQIVLPEPQRRFRVIGTDEPDKFCMGGFTAFMRMNLLLNELFGRGCQGFGRVLDWGCGCGRVGRYFSDIPGVSFSGADVDADNVAWCSQNLTYGSFREVPLLPPTSFEPNSFDLIYGLSVFTHLREPAQRAWLAELQRITAPGGVLVMTIHGTTALNYSGLPMQPVLDLYDRVQQEGFVVTSSNDQLNDVIDDKAYYVNVMHSWPYIRRTWGQYFDVVRIVPGFFHTHDAVVLRR